MTENEIKHQARMARKREKIRSSFGWHLIPWDWHVSLTIPPRRSRKSKKPSFAPKKILRKRTIGTKPEHMKLTIPKAPTPTSRSKDSLKYLVRQFLKEIAKSYRVNFCAAGTIVHRPGSPPHAHLLILGGPAPRNGNAFSALDPKEIIKQWPYQGRITTRKQWRTVSGYPTKSGNLNLDGARLANGDIFYYREKMLLDSLEARRHKAAECKRTLPFGGIAYAHTLH